MRKNKLQAAIDQDINSILARMEKSSKEMLERSKELNDSLDGLEGRLLDILS